MQDSLDLLATSHRGLEEAAWAGCPHPQAWTPPSLSSPPPLQMLPPPQLTPGLHG